MSARMTAGAVMGESDLSELELFERWRYVRKEILDITQREVASELGVDVRTVKGWEHPDQPRGAPTAQNAQRFADLATTASGTPYPAGLFAGLAPAEQTVLREINRKLDLIMAHLGIEDE